MDYASELILHDVRCFRGENRGRLRPITLLVGENSTGKTTFLSCYLVLHQLLRRTLDLGDQVDFNVDPFSMGSFRDIVSSQRGRAGRINAFSLAISFASGGRNRTQPLYVGAKFHEDRSQPAVGSLRFQFGDADFFEFRRSDEGKILLATPNNSVEMDGPIGRAFVMVERLTATKEFDAAIASVMGLDDPSLPSAIAYIRKLISSQQRVVGRFPRGHRLRPGPILPPLPQPVPLAPLRSKPKRTYDPVRETASPEGDHVPMLLMRLNYTEKDRWSEMHDKLNEFGDASGLFSDIRVQRHGKTISDPFQLQVKAKSGSHANIMDVGYGVSQSLPILVDVLNTGSTRPRSARPRTVFLLQQPEVHLHPRGQAELASFLVGAYKSSRNHFVVETHSDYIIDRVRISVMKGILSPDEVSILYFEPKQNSSSIHCVELDKAGNMVNVPEGFRDFFIREANELLGFDN